MSWNFFWLAFVAYIRANYTPTKSEAAFRLSLQVLREITKGRLYFWTFTASLDCSDAEFLSSWDLFWNTRVLRSIGKGASGLRVFQRTRAGRLHVHLIVDTYLDYNLLQTMKVGTCFGVVQWVEVVAQDPGQVEDYLARYLSRPSARIRGIRAWAKFGRWKHCPVSHVICESEASEVLRQLYARSKKVGPKAWLFVAQLLNEKVGLLVGSGDWWRWLIERRVAFLRDRLEWSEYAEAIKGFPPLPFEWVPERELEPVFDDFVNSWAVAQVVQ